MWSSSGGTEVTYNFDAKSSRLVASIVFSIYIYELLEANLEMLLIKDLNDYWMKHWFLSFVFDIISAFFPLTCKINYASLFFLRIINH